MDLTIRKALEMAVLSTQNFSFHLINALETPAFLK